MSSKDKDKKKKASKLEKKETKVINPSELESSQLIARVTNRLGDKETKNIANNEDDPYTKTFTSFNTDDGAQINNFSGIQNQYQLSYNNLRSSDQNTNQLKSESIQEYRNQFNQNPYYQQQQISTQQNYDQHYHQDYNKIYQEQRDYRYDQLRNQVNLSLLPKRQEILQQIKKIENRIGDIKYQTQKIENTTREECQLIIDRLKYAEYQMLYSLYQDKQELISNIEQIDEISSRILYNSEQILQTNYLYNIERLASIRIKNQIDIYSNDLPQEIFQLKQLQLQNKNLQKLMDFKNEVIWKLISDSKIDQLKIKKDLEREDNNEIQKCYNLVNQQQQELSKYKLQCIFCGINFDYQQINTNCDQNFQDAKLQFECQETPQKEFIGTQRHFFSKNQNLQQL
ncbi:unnamed protein product [Paramecium sonneborni]|uniref:Uncharacterized protein n=1 Tax=Paramecium sonneborni TaxID=65129 RepID=A0A8S1NYF4_9CILI|nr:unnamed protein product [Paramecium sonneborni]